MNLYKNCAGAGLKAAPAMEAVMPGAAAKGCDRASSL